MTFTDIALRGLGLLVLFGLAAGLGKLITWPMKDGRLKYALTRKRDAKDPVVIFWLVVPVLILLVLIAISPVIGLSAFAK